MVDITNITALINSFRAEVNDNSITPESLGSLLQKIVTLFAEAENDAQLQRLHEWKDAIVRLSQVITDIQQGNEDESSVMLSVDTVNMANGNALYRTDYALIKEATTARAGVMTAEHVAALDDATTNISLIKTLISNINDKLLSLKTSITSILNQLTGKANKANVYTKEEVDKLTARKANKADVYTKEEIDELVEALLGLTDDIEIKTSNINLQWN